MSVNFLFRPIRSIAFATAQLLSKPGRAIRQQTYLRALRTLACVGIHYGHYLQKPVMMPFATPPVGGPATVRVLKSEEKGSDVNLATSLLVDAFAGDFEQAVVVSNDSDLVYPIEVVQNKFGLPVVVHFPCGGGAGPASISAKWLWRRRSSTRHLAAAQFANPLADANGQFHKPAAW